jgi:hypothetical protein
MHRTVRMLSMVIAPPLVTALAGSPGEDRIKPGCDACIGRLPALEGADDALFIATENRYGLTNSRRRRCRRGCPLPRTSTRVSSILRRAN